MVTAVTIHWVIFSVLINEAGYTFYYVYSDQYIPLKIMARGQL